MPIIVNGTTITDVNVVSGGVTTELNSLVVGSTEVFHKYTVTGTATNATINSSTSYSGTIVAGGTLTLTVGADGTSYKLPTSITVTGATGTYTRTSDTVGTLVISNPTANVSFMVVGEEIATGYTVTLTPTSYWAPGYISTFEYSTDNGTTWNSVELSLPTTIICEQIMFRGNTTRVNYALKVNTTNSYYTGDILYTNSTLETSNNIVLSQDTIYYCTCTYDG